jgi:hypothetical protein
MASLFNCNGAGFTIDIRTNPYDMSVSGNGFNSRIINLNATTTFDTVITGNTLNPAATLKLVIKDSSFANPGDSFKALMIVSTPTGVKDYSGITCLKGND